MDYTNLMEFVFQLLNSIKMLHWATDSYAKHAALDSLYGSLSSKTDMLVEAFIGKAKKPAPLKVGEINVRVAGDPAKIPQFLEVQRDHLVSLSRSLKKDTEFVNIIEEMIAEVEKTMYLCRLA